jgi:hypothetical protein
MSDNDPRSTDLKIAMAEHFESFEHEYRIDENTDAELVYEDDQVIVVADHSGHELNEWASEFDVGRDELSEFFHRQARKMTDYDWGYADPVLFDRLEGEIKSTLVFDVEHYADYEPRERIAEGVHECGRRKVEILYDLDREGRETRLRVHTKYYLKNELQNESQQGYGRGESYRVEDGVVPHSGEDIETFVRSNFEVDPEIVLTDEFESMVDNA